MTGASTSNGHATGQSVRDERARLGTTLPVLVAEDDQRLAGLVCSALNAAGIPAEATHDGAGTIEWLKRRRARLLLLDIHLPDMEGRQVIELLERGGQEVPFVILSGAAETKVAVDYMRRGARDYLFKDGDLAAVVPQVVQRTLDDIDRDEQLSRLQREMLEISEREQQRIGQDLHDDVCQRLAAIKMQIQHLAESLSGTDPDLQNQVTTVTNRLADATRVARALARGLSPVDIGHEGLPAALSGLARNAEDIFQIECDFEPEGICPTLEHHVSTQFYRIAQEAIAHEVKHAQATHVLVRLISEDGRLTLSVTSDGTAPSRGGGERGLDVFLIRHRAESIGAGLRFQQIDVHGATSAIEVSYPLP